MTQRLLVIGNGMAAMQLVESLLQRAPQRYAITVIGREPHGNYNRVLLSPVLAGEMRFSETLIHATSWYQQHGVTLLAGETVQQVNLAARTVLTDQRQLGWDRLVFATGSQPRLPVIPGIDRPQVSGFRCISDVERLLAGHGPVAVLGGGFLGIEAAAALRAQGREVTLIHHKGWLLDRQLDARAGELLL
ncbi:NAD(P)/FAD-dependent oxidoreductase, partial [Pantoea conspicua]|uniref:NAD(P)/FAD-dependent oxidoreductase n=1 Tax=Pantoea conspicua TaxID=472705 RepID=UPI0011809B9D